MTKLKEYTIDGHTFEIEVSDVGEFSAKILGDWIKAPSLKGLTEKAKSMIRRSGRIAIPVTRIGTRYNARDREVPEIEQVTLTGAHGGNRNILYKSDKTGKTEQSSWGEQFYRRLSGPEIQAFMVLVKDVQRATNALEAWKEKHSVDPHALISEAAKQVEDKPADPAQVEAESSR